MELGKVEGFWSALQTLAEYLNVEQRAHWLLIIRKEPISCAMWWWCHNVRLSLTYQTAPSRVSWQNFGFIYTLQFIKWFTWKLRDYLPLVANPNAAFSLTQNLRCFAKCFPITVHSDLSCQATKKKQYKSIIHVTHANFELQANENEIFLF